MAVSNFIVIPKGGGSILIWSAPAALCVSAVLQLALVPTYGAVGAAIARVAAEMLTSVILVTKAVAIFRHVAQSPVVAVSQDGR